MVHHPPHPLQAGRVVRLLRLVRLIRLVKFYQKNTSSPKYKKGEDEAEALGVAGQSSWKQDMPSRCQAVVILVEDSHIQILCSKHNLKKKLWPMLEQKM